MSATMTSAYDADLLFVMGTPADVQCNSTYATWTFTIFKECVHNNLQMAGFVLGLISLLLWIVVFIPQFYESYKNGHCDQALSPLFLIMWLLGDISNLTGCLLSHQLPTQTYIAIYYIFMDILILSQFAYYKRKNRMQANISSNGDITSSVRVEPKHVIYGVAMFATFSWTGLLPWQQGQTGMREGHFRSGRSLLSYGVEENCMVPFGSTDQCMFYATGDLIGYVFGVVSGICYFLSRSPQILKNFQRKSVEGISLFMFIITVLGNLTYGLSVIFEDTSLVFLLQHLPWLVGSIGTLIFDSTIIVQFGLYSKNSRGPVMVGETQPLLA